MGRVENINDRMQDLKRVRELATDITKHGAVLFDLLGKEDELRVSALTSN
jgi:hypothetical protein